LKSIFFKGPSAVVAAAVRTNVARVARPHVAAVDVAGRAADFGFHFDFSLGFRFSFSFAAELVAFTRRALPGKTAWKNLRVAVCFFLFVVVGPLASGFFGLAAPPVQLVSESVCAS